MSKLTSSSRLSFQELEEMYTRLPEEIERRLKTMGVSQSLPHPDVLDPLRNIITFATNGDPICPRDITEVANEQLGQLFSLFTAWANYLACEEIRAKVEETILEEVSKSLRAAIILDLRADGTTGKESEEVVRLDGRWVQPHSDFLTAQCLRQLLASRAEQMRRTLNLISREQTRRGENMEQLAHDNSGGDGWRTRVQTRISTPRSRGPR